MPNNITMSLLSLMSIMIYIIHMYDVSFLVAMSVASKKPGLYQTNTKQTPRRSHHRCGKAWNITLSLSPHKEELQQRQKVRTSKDEIQTSES